MSDIEVGIRVGVLALIAVSGLVRLVAALLVPAVRHLVARQRAAHACWFAVSAVALLLLLRLFFATREPIHLSSAANPASGKAGIASRLQVEQNCPVLPEPGRLAFSFRLAA